MDMLVLYMMIESHRSPNLITGVLYRKHDINSLRPRWNRRHFGDDIFKCIFLNENVLISIRISLKFIPKGPINNITALVQKMAWCPPGDKPLSEPMMIILLTHICVTGPQWVKDCCPCTCKKLNSNQCYFNSYWMILLNITTHLNSKLMIAFRHLMH